MIRIGTAVVAVVACLAAVGFADGPKRPVLPEFTPDRETAALEFVEQHHAELAAVVKRLKSVNREQYEQAVRELFAQVDNLARIKPGDEELYDLMLAAWKVNSRIEVLAARLSCAKSRDEQLEEQLKELIHERLGFERSMVEHRRKRLLESLEKVEVSLKWFDENSERVAERRFQTLLRSAQRQQAQKGTK